MRFEWNKEKARLNLRKHGITFDEAVTVFYDPDHSIGEQRFITVGLSSSDRLLVVSHTDRGDAVRVISARRATAHEKRQHQG